MHKWIIAVMGLMLSVTVVADTLPADPTRPSVAVLSVQAAQKESVDYVLNALRIGQSHSVAVVNGQRVKTGDYIGVARVLSVTAKGVQLSVGTEQQFLSLSERQGFSKVKSGK